MKVRVIRDTYDYKAGTVVEMPQSEAYSWVDQKLAEFYRAKPAPQNEAKAKPKNKAKRKPTNRAKKR